MSSEVTEQTLLAPEEYQRRKQFLADMVGLTKPEYIEIIRILKKHAVQYSENQNGIFFNVATLSQAVFEDLVSYMHFSKKNRCYLSDRETLMSTLATSAERGI
jgi:hypothetical protein